MSIIQSRRMLQPIAFALLLSITQEVEAQRSITLDLASPVLEQPVEPNEPLRFLISNRLPEGIYTVSIKRSRIPIAPLDQTEVDRITNSVLNRLDLTPRSPCPNQVEDLRSKLLAAKHESNLPTILESALAQPAVTRAEGCPEILFATFDELTTREVPASVVLRNGEEARVRVQRIGGEEPIDYTFVVATEVPGRWQTTYSFAFIPDFDKRYFAKEADDEEGGFKITERDDAWGADLLPSLLFTWVPSNPSFLNGYWGLSAGLGTDLDDVAVLAGVSLTYWENVTFSLGGVFHKQNHLSGLYKPDERIATALQPEQIQEKVYRPNAFFSIGFRFGTTPAFFERDRSADPVTDEGAQPEGAQPEGAQPEGAQPEGAQPEGAPDPTALLTDSPWILLTSNQPNGTPSLPERWAFSSDGTYVLGLPEAPSGSGQWDLVFEEDGIATLVLEEGENDGLSFLVSEITADRLVLIFGPDVVNLPLEFERAD